MATMQALHVLAQAVAEGRLTAHEFMTVCLPFYKTSAEHYLSDDYWVGTGEPAEGTLTDDQARTAAADIAARMELLPTTAPPLQLGATS
ncbi:hypothetical protein ACFCV3_19610 [Kribbella sp. NPDC056345]|uniref:hypothetical protein n=1 Tax=Kribbella sp. NPDC056345 TaxID=3345789 RepID=UPI0035D8AE61